MPLDLPRVQGAIGVGAMIANLIMDAERDAMEKQKQRELEGAKRDSLVVAFTQEMYNEFVKHNANIRACVVTVSGLSIETNNLDYVGIEEIGGCGYTIYVGYKDSWIKNKGNRGFDNWCVSGFSRQTNDIIYIE
jgi:hypothetical protein